MPADTAPAIRLGPSPSPLRTLTLDEAAAFLHMHPEEVRTRSKRGVIPGAKAGRRWIFLEIDLAEFVRSLYPVRRQALQVTSQEAVCHLESVGRSGGSTSPPPVVSEYDDLLRPATRPRRKNCTTS
ncbi:MAG: helix-turn-helix domain-containing protein [Steroidobacteraceae bacterium]